MSNGLFHVFLRELFPRLRLLKRRLFVSGRCGLGFFCFFVFSYSFFLFFGHINTSLIICILSQVRRVGKWDNGIKIGFIDYLWNSHRRNVGGVDNGIAEPEYVLKYFSSKRKKAIDSYEKYLEQFALETDNEKKAKVYADYVMGSEIFVKSIKLMFKDKKLPEEIKERKILRKIYVPEQMNIKTCEYY
jgi:hypothetical protein